MKTFFICACIVLVKVAIASSNNHPAVPEALANFGLSNLTFVAPSAIVERQTTACGISFEDALYSGLKVVLHERSSDLQNIWTTLTKDELLNYERTLQTQVRSEVSRNLLIKLATGLSLSFLVHHTPSLKDLTPPTSKVRHRVTAFLPEYLDGEITFLTFVEKSLNIDTRLESIRAMLNKEDICMVLLASNEVAEVLINGKMTRIFPPENLETIEDNWVFYFKVPDFMYLFWVIVPREFGKPYSYGFN